MIAEEKQQGEMTNAAKFQSIPFGNALAVTRIPKLGHQSPSQMGHIASSAAFRHP